MPLLVSQKNQIFDLFVQNDISPNDFVLDEFEGLSFTIKKKNLPDFHFYCSPAMLNSGLSLSWAPDNDELFRDNVWIEKSWKNVLLYLESWVENLAKELNQIDKWEELKKSAENISVNLTDTNAEGKFSYQEVKFIQNSAEVAKDKIKQSPLLTEHFDQINEKLDYIAAKSETMNKIDWKNLMLGTIITLVMQIGLPENATKELWLILKEAFQQILLISQNL